MCKCASVLFTGGLQSFGRRWEETRIGGLTQTELSDWIKRSAWQPGRLVLARCSCHPLATHLAHKTLAQLVGPSYSLYGSQALDLLLPKLFPNCQI